MDVREVFTLAVEHHRAGRLAEAEVLYRQILAAEPQHADALHHLGVIAQQAGRHELAAQCIGQSIALNPNSAIAYSNYGQALRSLGRPEEATAAYRRVLELRPEHVETHNNLGIVLVDLGRLDEAAASYERALQLRPESPKAHNNLGVLLGKRGRRDEAIGHYRRALQLQPDYPDALNNLGTTLTDQGLLDEAVAQFHRALALQPNHALVYYNLGNALREQRRSEEAMAAFQRAILIRPEHVESYNNLGMILAGRGRNEEAIAAYREAIRLRPMFAEVHNNLGNALKDQMRLDEAAASYSQALQFQPDLAEAHNNLANALKEQGKLDESIASYRRALELKPDNSGFHSNLVYTLQLHPRESVRAIVEEQRRWNDRFGEPWRRTMTPHTNDRNPERRIRIGYVSRDFHAHAIAYFFTPLFEAHDHELFEIHAYSSVPKTDEITERLRKSADVWRDVEALTDAELADQIRGDGIDILVDLGMHTTRNRLPVFARQPAPVQVSWLAYPGSTGLAAIDYRLTDSYIDPVGEHENESGGRAWRLPDSWCCYEPIETFPPVGPLPALERGCVTFGTMNQFSKIHESLLPGWAKLLAAVPKSRLLMVCPEGQSRDRILAFFASSGIVSERLELVGYEPWPEYVRRFERIDIALDTYPCNGMTTTCHALWMGVPAVSWIGATAVSRAGSSLLHTVGLEDWIAKSEKEYLRIAMEKAGDLSNLTELRATLRSRMRNSPLMDARRFAHSVETAYRAMWKQWCAGQQS